MKSGLCSYENIGTFIFGTEDPDDHTPMTQTSFWTASVTFNDAGTAESNSPSFWDNPQGNPTPPPDNNTTPFFSRGVAPVIDYASRDDDPLNPSPSGTLAYTSPIQYQVRKAGYYCVGTLVVSGMMTVALYLFSTAIVPVTVMSPTTARQVPFHSTYNGAVLFRNTFDGKLPATDYPKVNVSTPSDLPIDILSDHLNSSISSCFLHMQYLVQSGRIYATGTSRNFYLFRCAVPLTKEIGTACHANVM